MINDAVIVTIYAVLAVFIIVTTVMAWVQHALRELIKTYAVLSICALGWLLSAVLFYFVTDPTAVAYVDNLPFFFIAFCPVALLGFAVRFYGSTAYITQKYIIPLCIIPAITCFIALFPQLSWMLRFDYQVISIAPLHVVQYTWNFWFYVHLVYSYFLMIATSVYIIRQHIKQPKNYSLPSKLMVVGIFIVMAFNTLTLIYPFPGGDYTLIGMSCSIVLFYFAIANNPTVEYLALARKALYNYIDLPVFILDKQNQILDLNLAAEVFLDNINCSISLPFTFDDMVLAIKDFGGQIETGYRTNSSTNIFVQLEGNNVVYTLTQRAVIGKKGQIAGWYIVMMDVTQLSSMIDELEYMTEIDPLTGIANRRAFDIRCRELDIAEQLPLSFIVGDVNRLKYVNDNMGHRQGDELLKLIARILSRICLKGGMSARIGGDEFILVLPKCDADLAKKLMKDIDAQVKEEASDFEQSSIALGVITKTHLQQNISDLINAADKAMYTQKRYDRRNEQD